MSLSVVKVGEIFCAGTLLWVQAFFKSVSTDGFESFERKSSRIAGWTCWPLRSAFLNDNDDDSDSDDGDDDDDDETAGLRQFVISFFEPPSSPQCFKTSRQKSTLSTV